MAEALVVGRAFLAELRVSPEGKGKELTEILTDIRNKKSNLERKTETLQSFQDNLDKWYKRRQQAKHLLKQSQKLKADCTTARSKISEIQSEPVHHEDDIRIMRQRDMFKEYCGLEFKTTAETMITIIFTNIDATDHKREFSISLAVDENTRKWIFISSDPEIQDISGHISRLNEENDFHIFCRELRGHYLRFEQEQRLKKHSKNQK